MKRICTILSIAFLALCSCVQSADPFDFGAPTLEMQQEGWTVEPWTTIVVKEPK